MIRLFFALLSFALLSCGAKGTKETGNMPEIKKQPIASAVPDFNAEHVPFFHFLYRYQHG